MILTQLIRKIIFFTTLSLFYLGASAHLPVGAKKGEVKKRLRNVAGCAPAEARERIELNNVRALLETGGNIWQDRTNGVAAYEVPNGSKRTAIFAGALWLGGVDANGQLKMAAVTFRQNGNDFWPGPLTTSGGANIETEDCAAYDNFFKASRIKVEEFVGWFNCKQDPKCDEEKNYPNYQIPQFILEWPAHGDESKGQDFYLAPFYDNPNSDNGANGIYDPINDGDYPWYDLAGDIDCKSSLSCGSGEQRRVTLFGDETLWWIFNDKGNIHTETGSEPIGMEVRVQAFAFATNNEINNMTFYNYELINRGTQTLYQTYFGQWVDADLGGGFDDYVGCDVQRGFGYCYNGDAFDEDDGSALGYGANPPAIGVDFFEGPYADCDGKDNAYGIGEGEALNGIGYGDDIIDNERFGMRRFVYYNNDPQSTTGDPSKDTHYYNYLRGIWKDGSKMIYGGTGHISDPNADPDVLSDFMFPGDSDPLNWGTGGQPQPLWTEQTEGNTPLDRRFIQSAGPFTLEPGAVNNITVGVVYARATGGDPFEAVKEVIKADEKAQTLFENCFKVLDGPDAPIVDVQELDKEVILSLSNPINSNNYKESYVEKDPEIPEYENDTIPLNQYFRFQGYQIFQLKDASVSSSDLENIDLARLVFQTDKKDEIDRLINFESDDDLGVNVPKLKVDGLNEGIAHTFKIKKDFFAQGNSSLINHKKYYYMAIAYGHNSYKKYIPDDVDFFDGQKEPYKAGRKSPSGAIRLYTAIPHKTNSENNGTVLNSGYGDGFVITRIEGTGNGGLALSLDSKSEEEIVRNGKLKNLTYLAGFGPIEVKIVDPLNVPETRFRLMIIPDSSKGMMDTATWVLQQIGIGGSPIGQGYKSDTAINYGNEQLFPEFGISVKIKQHYYLNKGSSTFTDFISGEMVFADSSKNWLTGIFDIDGYSPQNWIRAGAVKLVCEFVTISFANPCDGVQDCFYNDHEGVDVSEVYERVLGGMFSPWRLVSELCAGPISGTFRSSRDKSNIADIPSIKIVITKNKDLWTRCPVIELQEVEVQSQGGVKKMSLRGRVSVGKDGQPDGSKAPDGTPSMGMSWFPGYAINLETGERLNMAFGEDSWYAGQNGADMLWNPGSAIFNNFGEALFGGKHYIYVFDNARRNVSEDKKKDFMPLYDEGQFSELNLKGVNTSSKRKVWDAVSWVGAPLLVEGKEILSSDVSITIGVAKPYEKYVQEGVSETDLLNNGYPVYEFDTDGRNTLTSNGEEAKSALDLIRAVPNPYYGYSSYETGKLDNRVKITNLPSNCTIRILTVNGTIVRTLTKDDPEITWIEWDLKNGSGIPVAGGVYIIHVYSPNIGEKTIRWFGGMREFDFENF